MTAPSALAGFVEATLQVRPGEGRRTGLLFLHLLLASAVFFLGRTVRDTLFLSRYSLAALPWLFVAYGVASAATVVFYARVADRWSVQRLIAVTCGTGAATYLASWLAVRSELAWIYPAFYVWTEIVANLFVVQFWTLATDLHDARSAKRLFGTIGSARLVASVVVGLGTGAVVAVVGTAQLILVLVALMGGIVAVAQRLGGEARAERASRPAARPRRVGPPASVLGDPYISMLAVLLLVTFTAVNVGDFQFKAIARATYREDDLARFFALFYAGTGVVAFLFQLFVTPRLLARLGVGWGLTVMPAAFGGTSALLYWWPGLASATAMKFADNGFQYTIQETSLQALYLPFPSDTRARARAFLDAVIRPIGYALAGVLVIVLGAQFADAPEGFALVTVPLTAGWLALVPAVKRRYRRELEATLSARGAFALDEHFVLDAEGRRALARVLAHGEPRQVLVALEQLRHEAEPAVARALPRLVTHADPVVRAAALMHVAHTGAGPREAVRAALADAVDDVRAAAAAACAALLEDEAVDDLAPLLTDPAPDVRVAALAGLLKHGGVEGGIVGGGELGRLLASGERADLVSAARALRHLGPGAYRPLRGLLEDPDPVVRRAALKAAPGVADARLVPLLIGLLHDPACRHRAGQALVAIGEPAAVPLAALVGNVAVSRAVRLEVPRLLRRIARPATYTLLREQVGAPDGHLRLRIYAALAHLRRELGRAPESIATLQRLIAAEIAEAETDTAGWTRARAEFGSPLLEEEFALRRGRAVRRVLRLLELRYDADSLRLVRTHLAEPARRANALEVLDTLLDPALRPLVMPFVDDDLAARRPPRPAPDPVDFLVARCRHANPYLAALALDALARRGEAAARREAEALLAHPEPLMREAARRALARLTGRADAEDAMYSTIEKVLLLKSAPVFARVTGEDLAPLARIAEAEVYAPGQRIFARGDPGDALFVITRGQVAIGDDGRVLATLGPGDTMGEMAVLDNEVRVASAVAVDEVETLRIASDAFYEVLHEQVEIAEGVIRMLCGRLREADARLMSRRTQA